RTRTPFLSDVADSAHRPWWPARSAAHLLRASERLALTERAYAVVMSTAAVSVIRAPTAGSRARWLAWSSVLLFLALAGISIALIALFLPLLFPDGRLPSPRWRPAAYVAGASVVLAVVLTMVAPATYAHAGYPSISNPIGLNQYANLFDGLGLLLQPLLLVLRSEEHTSELQSLAY